MATRIAITIVLCCIGVMLLSACGFSVMPRKMRVGATSLILTRTDSRSLPLFLGTASIDVSDLRHLSGMFSFEESACTRHTVNAFVGAIDGTPAGIHLVSDLGVRRLLHIDGPAEYSADYGYIHQLRFTGTMSGPGACSDGKPFTFKVEGAPFTPLLGSFRGDRVLRDGGHESVALFVQEFRFDLQGYFGGRSSIQVLYSPCFRTGERTDVYRQHIASTELKEVYTMDDGSKLTAVIARAPWQGRTHDPLQTHFSVAGGKCDGQSYDLTMTAF